MAAAVAPLVAHTDGSLPAPVVLFLGVSAGVVVYGLAQFLLFGQTAREDGREILRTVGLLPIGHR
jgi:hypothetical protein